jgi:hypothetical protein
MFCGQKGMYATNVCIDQIFENVLGPQANTEWNMCFVDQSFENDIL